MAISITNDTNSWMDQEARSFSESSVSDLEKSGLGNPSKLSFPIKDDSGRKLFAAIFVGIPSPDKVKFQEFTEAEKQSCKNLSTLLQDCYSATPNEVNNKITEGLKALNAFKKTYEHILVQQFHFPQVQKGASESQPLLGKPIENDSPSCCTIC